MQMKLFFSYGYDESKSNRLYSVAKKFLPNIFQGTCFSKHTQQILDGRLSHDFSALFFYLPSTIDCSESINQYLEYVLLHPIDCLYERFKQYSCTGKEFIPQDLDSRDLEKWHIAVQIVQNCFKEAVNVPNSNLICNANHLILTLPQVRDDIAWVSSSKNPIKSDKFKLSY